MSQEYAHDPPLSHSGAQLVKCNRQLGIDLIRLMWEEGGGKVEGAGEGAG